MPKSKTYTLEYFRRMGRRGGNTRKRKLTAQERSAAARTAAKARWARRKAV